MDRPNEQPPPGRERPARAAEDEAPSGQLVTCPYCRAEIPAQAVKCRHCGEWVDGRSEAANPARRDTGLSGPEVALFALLFLLFPVANIVIAHVLYVQWRKATPRKAGQLNLLSFGCFGLQLLGYYLWRTVAYR